MSDNSSKILKKIHPTRVILPLIFGLAGIAVMLYYDKTFTIDSFSLITVNYYFILFIFIAFIMMFIRDFGYILRLRVLTEGKLTWRKLFNIVMLWEFASAVTPGAIGGTGVAVVFIHKEGLSVGKSTSVVMATSLLDELYFILVFPVILIIAGPLNLFSIADDIGASGSFDYTNKYFLLVGIAYLIKLIWVLFMAYGLFVNPKFISKIIKGIFKIRFLKRWKNGAEKAGDDVITSSAELKAKPFVFWIKAFGATFFSWTARYWVLNFLLIALIMSLSADSAITLPDIGQNILIFARQLVMWIIMVILPTPGGSGLVELIFSDYLAEFIPLAGMVSIMAVFWRLITYYPYLILGVFVLPKWVQRVFSKK